MCATSKIIVSQGVAVSRSSLPHHHPHIMGWCGVAARRTSGAVSQPQGVATARYQLQRGLTD